MKIIIWILIDISLEVYSNFPPTLINVGSYEVLLDDAIEMAKILKESSNNECKLEIYEGQVHDFTIFVGWLPEAHDALNSIYSFIKQYI